MFPPVTGLYMGRFYQVPAAFLIASGLALGSCIAWKVVLMTCTARRIAAAPASAFVVFMLIWPRLKLFIH
jgi:hypothetical protein